MRRSRPATIPAAPAGPSGASVQLLLSDSQMRFGPAGDEFYSETVFKVLTPSGLAAVSHLAPSWNPETETLTFHHFNLIRGSKVIDLLDGGKKVTVLRRETNLELAMLDGDLTAALQPEGLQVGDVVDLGLTLTRRDPVMHGFSQAENALRFVGIAAHLRIRGVWPDAKPIRWRTTEGMAAPRITRSADGTELSIELDNAEAPKPPAHAPDRYADLGALQLTQFGDWSTVSALMSPLYDKADTLAPSSPLKAEAQQIAAASSDPKTRAEAALRLVQDEVRYAFVGMNLGGYVPADADLTWRRRFGDCKGKTALLIALLRELGVSAQPALVASVGGDGLDRRLPMLAFDHVIVRAVIGGKVYWLDGTRTGDRNLDEIRIPDFHWALPVQAAGARLVKLTPAPLDQPAFESRLRLDASAGLDARAPAHAEHLFRGDAAVGWNLLLTAAGRIDAEKSLRDYWRGQLAWIDVKTVDFAFDDVRRVMRLTMDGSASMDWRKSGGARDFEIDDSNLGFEPSFKRDPGPGADAPFTVAFPSFNQWTVTITLPRGGVDFGLLNAGDVDQTIAAVRYQRRSRIQGGVMTMTASERSLAPEFAASEAESATTQLRNLTAYDVTVRDAALPTNAAQVDASDAGPPPADAAGFATRAAGRLEAADYVHAIADFDQAIRLDPTSAKFAYDRGVAHFENHQDDLALADFDRALRLNPSDAFALDARAQVHLIHGDAKQARADFDAAAKVAPNDTRRLAREAKAYDSAARFDDELEVLDRLIARAPSAEFYNDRCLARAESGRNLDAALRDCDAALRLEPGYAAALNTKALTELRLGRLDDSIRDYDDAVGKGAEATAFFGRGVAELRKGEKQKSDKDLADARRLEPAIDADFTRIGLTP
jgi:tetratricopeptide (TPR) repeat protein